MPMNIAFPFQFDSFGRTAATGDDDHLREMIEELLFTSPGERVNRPDFGSGLAQLVFAPSSPELAATLRFTIQAALQRWLGDLMDLRAVTVESADSALTVTVEYAVRRTGAPRVDVFARSAP